MYIEEKKAKKRNAPSIHKGKRRKDSFAFELALKYVVHLIVFIFICLH